MRNGVFGPDQRDCDEAYRGKPTKVAIGDANKTKAEAHLFGYVTGIQRWTVPRTDIYT